MFARDREPGFRGNDDDRDIDLDLEETDRGTTTTVKRRGGSKKKKGNAVQGNRTGSSRSAPGTKKRK